MFEIIKGISVVVAVLAVFGGIAIVVVVSSVVAMRALRIARAMTKGQTLCLESCRGGGITPPRIRPEDLALPEIYLFGLPNGRPREDAQVDFQGVWELLFFPGEVYMTFKRK